MWGATEVPGEENQAMCIEVGLSEWTCPVGLHETMKAKLNLQFRLQDAGAARNMKHLLKKKLQPLKTPKKEAMCGLGCRVQIHWSLHDDTTYQDARYGASRFTSLCQVLTYLWLFLCHAPSLSFGM